MTTDRFIADLSRNPPRRTFSGRGVALVAGAALLSLVVALAISFFWLAPRNDLAFPLLAANHIFLLKIFFTVGVAVSILPVVCDTCIPGRRFNSAFLLAVVPFVVIAILAIHEIAVLPTRAAGEHLDRSWLDCLWQIPSLAAPAFIILAVTARHFAPTNLKHAGFFIGLLAGGIGAIGYTLHCHHDSLAFVGIAYTSAIAEMAILGGLIGPRVLQWR